MTRVRVQTFEESGITGQVWIRDTASPDGGAYGSGGGGGGASVKAATISVPFGLQAQTVNVVDALCTAASKVLVGWGAAVPTDENEPSAGAVTFSAVPLSGSFDVTVSSDNAESVGGAYKIIYTIG